VFSKAYAIDENKQKQWQAFLNRNGLKSELSFADLIYRLQCFLEPAYCAVFTDQNMSEIWIASDWCWRR
jgi:hypothetical protein